jgi:CRP/FNR family cyclic AMP-dependent transcriptional regulator
MTPTTHKRAFNAEAFLSSPGLTRTVVEYPPAALIYAQGDPCVSVFYIQEGSVKLSVVSTTGKEAVVGLLDKGDFFGEAALAGQSVRLATAHALTESTILVIPKQAMIRLLRQQRALSDRFISHLLTRGARVEADLIDQRFNGSEQRLARRLLLLARYGERDGPRRRLPAISQEALAEMVGTTRGHINIFMTKFRKLGFIDYRDDVLEVHDTLISIVLHDDDASRRTDS